MEQVGTFEHINLADIHFAEHMLRPAQKKKQEYADLTADILSRGLQSPITVQPRESVDGEHAGYEIVNGVQRYSIFQDLKRQTIPAFIQPRADDTTSMFAQMALNVHVVPTSPVELSKFIQAVLAKNPLWSIEDVAKGLNKTPAYCNKILSLVKKLPEPTLKLVNEGKISAINAITLAQLDEEEQDAFVARAMTETGTDFAQAVKNRRSELRKDQIEGRKNKPAEFQPIQKLRQMKQLIEALNNPKIGEALVGANAETCKTAVDGFQLGMAYALHFDPESIRQQEQRYNQLKEAERLKKDAAKAEKEAAKAEKAAASKAEAAIAEAVL